MAQTVISYPGAKWRFWPYIKPYIPRDIKEYREAFFGGGSVGLSIADDPDFNLERIVVGDLSPEIWALWTGIRDSSEEVVDYVMDVFKKICPSHSEIHAFTDRDMSDMHKVERGYKEHSSNPSVSLSEWAKSMGMNDDVLGKVEIYDRAIKEARELWRWCSEVDCNTLTTPQRAARMYLVNRISFSALGDSGSLSKDRFKEFNMEEGVKRIFGAVPLLKRMEIYNQSFEETMKDVNHNDTFIFLDPPYYKQEKSGLYGRKGDMHRGFQHEVFAEVTKNTDCRWFVTYDDSIKVRRMFRGKVVYSGKKCEMVEFRIPGGYTMALTTSEDALSGEELFILNY